MLSQIVRPLVETQIRLLANSQTTRHTLVETIIRWLGYLGVQAEVTELSTQSQKIQVTLKVAQPENCNQQDWQKIINNLASDGKVETYTESGFEQMTDNQQIQLARMLAYILQAGQPEQKVQWEIVEKTLEELHLDNALLPMIKSALKIPQSAQLLEKIDGDVAAYAFPIAVKLSWLDQKVTAQENEALVGLLSVIG